MKRRTWKRVLSVFLAAVLFMGTPMQKTAADEAMPVIEVQTENMVNIQIVDSEGNCPDGVYVNLYDETDTRVAYWEVGSTDMHAEFPLWTYDNFWVPYSVFEDAMAPYEIKDYEVISGRMMKVDDELSFHQGEDTVVEVSYIGDRKADYVVPANSFATFVNSSWEAGKREKEGFLRLESGDESYTYYLKDNLGETVHTLEAGEWKARVGVVTRSTGENINISSEPTEYIKVRQKLTDFNENFQDDGTLVEDGVVILDLSKELGETSAVWAVISGSVITIPLPDEEGYIEFYVRKDTREYDHCGIRSYANGSSTIGGYGNVGPAYDTKQIMFKPYTYPTEGYFFASVPAGTYTLKFYNRFSSKKYVYHDASFVAKDTKELQQVKIVMHELTYVRAAAASCTQTGNEAYYLCSCGRLFEDDEAEVEITDRDSIIIPKKPHNYYYTFEDEEHLRSEATNCQEKNTYWKQCWNCDTIAGDDPAATEEYFESDGTGAHPYDTTRWAYQEADGHAHQCTLCDAHDTVEAHIPGAEATETTPQTCTVCGYELAPIVPHVHRLTGVSADDASCTEAGNKAYYTCNCGKWFEDAEAAVEITDKDSVVIDALGHDYTEKLADNAHLKSEASNCQEKNVYWYDCSRCNANAKNDTEASDKYYTGAEIGAHPYDTTRWAYQEADGHAHQCTLCDTYDTVEAHTPGAEATETTPQTCTVCGYELAPIVPHVHRLTGVSANAASCTEAGNKAYYTCVCGKWFEDAQAAVEITDKDSVVIDALGHQASDWKYDEEEHWTVCTATACGVVIEGSLAGHDYGTDNVCDTCGYVKVVPTPEPTAVPTVAPTAAPTAVPTAAPTAVPTAAPTAVPTAVPTAAPTAVPTAAPTAVPTAVPTAEPTAVPTAEPTAVPTAAPTAVPTVAPTAEPTAVPTAEPTAVPTAAPTVAPTAAPTAVPTAAPTAVPTAVPTAAPTAVPTVEPTAVPTAEPTAVPTPAPTVAPTPIVTQEPVKAPKTGDNADKVLWFMFGMAGVAITFFYKNRKKQ